MNDIEKALWANVLAMRWVLGKDMRRAVADANDAVLILRGTVKEGALIPVRPEDMKPTGAQGGDE